MLVAGVADSEHRPRRGEDAPSSVDVGEPVDPDAEALSRSGEDEQVDRQTGLEVRRDQRVPARELPRVTGARGELLACGREDPDLRLAGGGRSEEHTSELQSPCNLVCRLLLDKKKNNGVT